MLIGDGSYVYRIISPYYRRKIIRKMTENNDNKTNHIAL